MPNLESEQSPEQKNQAGQGLKIQTPNQILSRLLIHLAQLQSGTIHRNLKMRSGSCYILCIAQKINQNKQ